LQEIIQPIEHVPWMMMILCLFAAAIALDALLSLLLLPSRVASIMEHVVRRELPGLDRFLLS
jgi:hypothetical protein